MDTLIIIKVFTIILKTMYLFEARKSSLKLIKENTDQEQNKTLKRQEICS